MRHYRRAATSCLAFLIVLMTTFPGSLSAANLTMEASLASGSTDNLFSESNTHYSNFSTVSIDLNYHPLSFAKVNFQSEYAYYRQFANLSNLLYGGGLTLIPTSDASRLSLILMANIRKREYRANDRDTASINANEFTGNEYDALMAIGYNLTENIKLRLGASLASVGYEIDGVMDRDSYEVFAGGNTTFFGRYGFDVEIGFARGKYQFIDSVVVLPPPIGVKPRAAIDPGEQYDILLNDELRSFYISPRLSTSLGRRTGISLTYFHRRFLDHSDGVTIYGYSTGHLSPWIGTYEGGAIRLNIKTYLVPRLIVTLGAGYWERHHFNTVEQTIGSRFGIEERTVNLLFARNRTDHRRRLSLTVQWPRGVKTGFFFEPSLQIDYINNDSNSLIRNLTATGSDLRVYDFSSFSVSGGVTIRL